MPILKIACQNIKTMVDYRNSRETSSLRLYPYGGRMNEFTEVSLYTATGSSFSNRSAQKPTPEEAMFGFGASLFLLMLTGIAAYFVPVWSFQVRALNAFYLAPAAGLVAFGFLIVGFTLARHRRVIEKAHNCKPFKEISRKEFRSMLETLRDQIKIERMLLNNAQKHRTSDQKDLYNAITAYNNYVRAAQKCDVLEAMGLPILPLK